ncbi:hypothetical protein KA977_07815 [Candidatus Dependentiae bacterium]|nr:hypothetical protein [Candidatus Dependentiae bacterium]
MDIIINKEKINFEIQGDEDFKSILEDLRNWLYKKKHIVLKILINGQQYLENIHDKMQVYDLNKVEIESEHIEILTLNSIAELKNYSDRIDEHIEKIKINPEQFPDNKLLEIFTQLKDGFGWCVKAIENIAKVLEIKNDIEIFRDFIFSLNELEGILDPVKIKLFFTDGTISKLNSKLIANTALLFTELKSKKTLLSFDEILEKIGDCQNKLSTLKNELTAVSEKLQIGESAGAMNELKEKFLFLETVINFYSQLQNSLSIDYSAIKIKDKSLQDYLNDYLKLMQELLDAFESKDNVMLADLIEYEVTEYIEVFNESFTQIKMITNKLAEASEQKNTGSGK